MMLLRDTGEMKSGCQAVNELSVNRHADWQDGTAGAWRHMLRQQLSSLCD